MFFFYCFVFLLLETRKTTKAAWLFQTSSNHNIEKFFIIPFLIYADITVPIALSYYYLFSLIIMSFNQGVHIQLVKSN